MKPMIRFVVYSWLWGTIRQPSGARKMMSRYSRKLRCWASASVPVAMFYSTETTTRRTQSRLRRSEIGCGVRLQVTCKPHWARGKEVHIAYHSLQFFIPGRTLTPAMRAFPQLQACDGRRGLPKLPQFGKQYELFERQTQICYPTLSDLPLNTIIEMAIKRAAELAAGAAKRTRSSPRLNNNSDLTTVTPKKGKDINKGKGKQSAQAEIDLAMDFEDKGDISSSDDDDEYDGTWSLDDDIVLNDQFHQYEDGISTSVNEIEDPCPELADEIRYLISDRRYSMHLTNTAATRALHPRSLLTRRPIDLLVLIGSSAANQCLQGTARKHSLSFRRETVDQQPSSRLSLTQNL
ncbi:hypothetical protein C7974DRAFT_439419 [Boeremia exigua]|uniref:uncharacterized protein n=1 Tax=Boeremia exigua TaxID=749465 RepID=UPI001E8D51A0|nr:uncharacterized protein C7974DRAFT_439419 [Boeremia exigua]KAH6644146.1 hypothetical protein C7974DRAFT_439419 [Boeremia exigua]